MGRIETELSRYEADTASAESDHKLFGKQALQELIDEFMDGHRNLQDAILWHMKEEDMARWIAKFVAPTEPRDDLALYLDKEVRQYVEQYLDGNGEFLVNQRVYELANPSD